MPDDTLAPPKPAANDYASPQDVRWCPGCGDYAILAQMKKVLAELAVGEALVSVLDANGQPGMVKRAFVVPPHRQIGPITSEQRRQIMAGSAVAGVYDQVVDHESGYERLSAGHAAAAAETAAGTPQSGFFGSLFGGGTEAPAARLALPKAVPQGSGRQPVILMDPMAKSVVRT